jgi:hypothetical protein
LPTVGETVFISLWQYSVGESMWHSHK